MATSNEHEKKHGCGKKINYTLDEKVEFERLVLSEPDILSTRIDSESLKKKAAAWDRVRQTFNSLDCCKEHRSEVQLRKLWDNMKNKYKKIATAKKQFVMKTSDGVISQSFDDADDDMELMVDVIDVDHARKNKSDDTAEGQETECCGQNKKKRQLSMLESLYELKKIQMTELHHLHKKEVDVRIKLAEAKIKAAEAKARFYSSQID